MTQKGSSMNHRIRVVTLVLVLAGSTAISLMMGGCPANPTPGGQQGSQGDPGPQGDAGAQGAQGVQGIQGVQGLAGADGQLRVYGNGSAGAHNITAGDEDWSGNNPTTLITNLQFTDFTIANGRTLTVPTGTVIRCTGTFTNGGAIVVNVGAAGSHRNNANSTTVEGALTTANPGVSRRAPGNGEIGANADVQDAGFGGANVDQLTARNLVMSIPFGGGGGGTGFNGSAGAGGGSFVVLAKTGIVNTGTISANGSTSANGGGGAGGIIVLASMTSVSNTGTINANGANGADSNISLAACGGGGGGIIHLLAPTVTAGTTNVTAGSGGSTATAPTNSPRSSGAGGGGCGGAGGTGSNVSTAGGTQGGTTAAAAGYTLTSVVDPTSLF